MLTAALGFLAAGFVGYAFVENPWQGFLASAVTGIGNGAFWPAQSTLLAGLTTRAQRTATFAMQRVVMNLGIGLGGVAGGLIATESFQALFLLDALTFVAYAGVLPVFVPEPARQGGAARALRQVPDGLPAQGVHGRDGRSTRSSSAPASRSSSCCPRSPRTRPGSASKRSAGSSSSTRS